MSEAESILNSVNISIRDMSGNIRPVSDILEELAGKWMTLSDEQRQNIGVTLAGRYQLSRFLALMNNWNLAVEASETALNSQGSAMREQIKYTDSLEARLNRLDTAWNKVVLSASSAVVTDGFIATVETLNDVATVSSFMIDKVGLLSGVFGTLGTATVLLSTRFRTFTASLIFGTEGMTRAQLAAAGLTTGMSRLGIATAGATAALRGLAASTVVGLVFVGIGFALEKLIKLYSDAKQKQEEFEQSQQKNIEALTTNKEQTEELIASYKALSAEKENGQWDNEKEKEYLRIQQQLGEIFPNLISHIDSTGQYHLKSANAIDKEIEATKELIKLKQEEIKLSALKNFEDNIDKIDGFFGLEKQIERKREQVKELEKIGADPLYINKMKQELRRLESEFATTSMKINDEVLKVAEAYNKLEINPEIRKSVQDFISSLDLTKLNPKELESFSIKIASLTDKMQKAYESGNEKTFDKAKKALIEYVSQMGATNNQANSLDITLEKVKKRNEQLANATYAGADGMDVMADSMSDVAENGEQATSIYDHLNKKYKETSDKMAVLNKLMEDMANGKQITAAEATELISKVNELANAITIENGQVVVNIEAVEEMRKANKKAYSDIIESVKQGLIAQTTATINKLKLFSSEIRGLKNVEEAHRLVGEAIDKLNERIYGARSIQEAMAYEKQKRELESYGEELEKLANMEKIQQEALNQVGTSFEENAKKQEKANKSTEKSIYIADKYKQQLEKVNTELEKINAIKSKFPQHSKEYQKALKQEIELLKQQKKIYEDQTKDLQRQIKSGKIQQTGIISTKSTKVSGNSTEATIWNFFASKGFSDSVIAGIMGNLKHESGLRTDAKNPSSGATGLAQWLGSRLTGLKKYAASLGRSWKELDVQLNYLWKELNSTEKRTLNWLRNNQNADPATVAKMFDKLFERSGGAGLKSRITHANQYYEQFANGNASRDAAEAQQAIDEAKIEVNQLKQQSERISSEITELYGRLVDSFIAEYEYSINYIQNKVKESELKAQSLDKSSEVYRSAINEQAYQLTLLDKKLNDEIWFLRHQAQNNKNISPQKREELLTLAKEKESERTENKLRIQDLLFEKVNSKIREYSDQIDDLNYKLDRSTKVMSTYKEGSEEWNKELQLQKQLLQEKAQLLLKEQEVIRKLMMTTSLSAEQQKELQEALEETSLAYWDVMIAQEELAEKEKQVREQLADQVIDIIKKSYEKQKELELAAIDQRMEALEKAHEKQMEMYDEDLERFEEVINAKLRLIDEQAEEEDYNKELSKLQSQEQEIVNKINVLSLDDSYEAKAKRLELQKELENIREQIEEKRVNRERELRKRNLQDQLDDYREDIENKKEIEQEKYDVEKERLENLKEQTRYYYDEMINDERRYAQIREQIYQGSTQDILSILNNFLSEFEKYNQGTVMSLKSSWVELLNLISTVKQTVSDVSNLSNTPSSSSNLKGRLETGLMVYSKAQMIMDKLKSDYGASNVQMQQSGFLYKVIGEFNSLDKANDVFKKLIDLYYITGQVQAFDTGGYTGNQEGLAFLHKKELVLNDIQTEHILKSISILDKFKDILPKFNIPILKLSPATAGRQTEAHNYEYNINIHIENMNGDKNSLNTFSDQIMQKIKRTKGGRF